MEEVISLGKLAAPYGKEIELQQVAYDNGFVMMRVRIKEGKRFTTLDLDPDTAQQWLDIMGPWATENKQA